MIIMISECIKLAKKIMNRHDWVGKVIYWELCKEFKFDHTNKWYMHNPESFLENGLHSHDQLYKHICICMQNHNDTIKTSDTVF